jgi:integrase
VTAGAMFRAINKKNRVATHGFSPKVIWSVVTTACSQCGLLGVAPHDLRRTCARLCHDAGGEIEQIQYLLGHQSVQTTERYIGCKQRLRNAVNDRIGLEAYGTSRRRDGPAVTSIPDLAHGKISKE